MGVEQDVVVKEVHEEEPAAAPKGIPATVFVGPNVKINLQTTPENTVKQVIEKVNAVLADFDGWTEKETKVTALSSMWALEDHLEYCDADKLNELDGYEENAKQTPCKLHFLGLNPEHFDAASYDTYEADG